MSNFFYCMNFSIFRYKNLLRDARIYEFERHNVILCTCSQASSPSLTKTVSARQVIIDECAMATEPQALIPLVCNKPEKVSLSVIFTLTPTLIRKCAIFLCLDSRILLALI